jgi:hypothetical protein
MANEIQANYSSGETLYAVIRNRTGQVWYATGQSFEDWGTSGRTAADYDIALTDKGGNRYLGDFDTNVPAGTYCIQIFRQIEAAPADTDTLAGSRDIIWTGNGELTATKMLANKSVQNKATGAISYYDDDNETVLVTHMPQEGTATLARMAY